MLDDICGRHFLLGDEILEARRMGSLLGPQDYGALLATSSYAEPGRTDQGDRFSDIDTSDSSTTSESELGCSESNTQSPVIPIMTSDSLCSQAMQVTNATSLHTPSCGEPIEPDLMDIGKPASISLKGSLRDSDPVKDTFRSKRQRASQSACAIEERFSAELRRIRKQRTKRAKLVEHGLLGQLLARVRQAETWTPAPTRLPASVNVRRKIVTTADYGWRLLPIRIPVIVHWGAVVKRLPAHSPLLPIVAATSKLRTSLDGSGRPVPAAEVSAALVFPDVAQSDGALEAASLVTLVLQDGSSGLGLSGTVLSCFAASAGSSALLDPRSIFGKSALIVSPCIVTLNSSVPAGALRELAGARSANLAPIAHISYTCEVFRGLGRDFTKSDDSASDSDNGKREVVDCDAGSSNACQRIGNQRCHCFTTDLVSSILRIDISLLNDLFPDARSQARSAQSTSGAMMSQALSDHAGVPRTMIDNAPCEPHCIDGTNSGVPQTSKGSEACEAQSVTHDPISTNVVLRSVAARFALSTLLEVASWTEVEDDYLRAQSDREYSLLHSDGSVCLSDLLSGSWIDPESGLDGRITALGALQASSTLARPFIMSNLNLKLPYIFETLRPRIECTLNSRDVHMLVEEPKACSNQRHSSFPLVPASFPGITCTLPLFQRRAVSWMLHREGASLPGCPDKSLTHNSASDGVVTAPEACCSEPIPLWHPGILLHQQSHVLDRMGGDERTRVWLSPLTGHISSASPLASSDGDIVRGGILAEEMGLGKTVETISLIVAHPRPPASITQLPNLVPFAVHQSLPLHAFQDPSAGRSRSLSPRDNSSRLQDDPQLSYANDTARDDKNSIQRIAEWLPSSALPESNASIGISAPSDSRKGSWRRGTLVFKLDREVVFKRGTWLIIIAEKSCTCHESIYAQACGAAARKPSSWMLLTETKPTMRSFAHFSLLEVNNILVPAVGPTRSWRNSCLMSSLLSSSHPYQSSINGKPRLPSTLHLFAF